MQLPSCFAVLLGRSAEGGESDPIRLRPTPHEYALYYDV